MNTIELEPFKFIIFLINIFFILNPRKIIEGIS